jgi:hypothetical protein
LDLKRSGDALQALMVKKLNDIDKNKIPSESEFYIFVTLDHLAFLKARLNGIPTIYTALQHDADVYNRVVILFNLELNSKSNYKAISSQLLSEKVLFDQIKLRLEELIPVITNPESQNQNEIAKKRYFRFYLMIDYICRTMFGIVIFVRPIKTVPEIKKVTSYIEFVKSTINKLFYNRSEKSEIFNNSFLKIPNERNQTIMMYLKTLLNENYNLVDSLKDKWKFQYYIPFVDNCFLTELQNNLQEISTLIKTVNSKISTAKNILNAKVKSERESKNIPELSIPEEYGLINEFIINENLNKFIINSFIIECFYTIKRLGIFHHYLYDEKSINTNDITSIISNLQSEEVNEKTSADATNYLEKLKILNKKYQCFTSAPGIDITISDDINKTIINNSDNTNMLIKFFEDYKNESNNNDVKNYLNKLFGFKFEDYKNIIEKLKKIIQKTFDKDIYPKIDIWINKFQKPGFFDEPVRSSRNSLTIKDKIKECQDFFNPITYNKNVQELLYAQVYNLCETFYKNKIEEFNIVNISSKPIPFEKAIDKIIQDEPIKEDFTIIGKKIDTNENKRQRINGGAGGVWENEQIINNLYILLDCDLLYDEKTYEGVSGWNDDCASRLNNLDNYREIYIKYKYFIIDIFNYNAKYAPIIINIDKNTYDEWGIQDEKTKKWVTVANITDILKYISNIIITYKDESLIDKIKNYRLFIFNILTDVLKQIIDKFYDAISDQYQALFNTKNYNITKGTNAVYDIIIWMMINDPTMVLHHPQRNITSWDIVESNIINVMNNNLLKTGGGYRDVNKKRYRENVDITREQNGPPAYTNSLRTNNVINNDDGNMNEDIDDYIDKNMDEYMKYSPDEITDIDMDKQNFDAENLDFMTMDEYIYMKCIFDSNFLLKTNLGILSCIDISDVSEGNFKFRDDINIYNNNKIIESKEISIDGTDQHPFENEISLFSKDLNEIKEGGNKQKINKFATLADYHKKYYKEYYKLYYT